MITFEQAPDIIFTPKTAELAKQIYNLRFGNIWGQNKKDKFKEQELLKILKELNKK